MVSSLQIDGQTKAQDGQLVLHLQDGPDEEELVGPRPTVTSLNGNIESVSVEQNGPVRAVIKVVHQLHPSQMCTKSNLQVTGKYTGSDHADILPFIVRFYVSSGSTSLRLVHFFIFDGDQNKDFIKGLVRILARYISRILEHSSEFFRVSHSMYLSRMNCTTGTFDSLHQKAESTVKPSGLYLVFEEMQQPRY